MASPHLAISTLVALLCFSLAQAQTSTNCTQYGLNDCNACFNPDPWCIDCPTGYRLLADRSGCVACTTGSLCAVCSLGADGTEICDQCVTTAAFDSNGVCQTCSDNCLGCYSSGGSLLCSNCRSPGPNGRNMVLSKSLDQCLECPENCITCTAGDTGTAVCETCVDKYTARSQDGRCINCPTNCKTCQQNAAGLIACSACVDGYLLVVGSETVTNGACTACTTENCASCGNGVDTCSGCLSSYYLKTTDSTCVSCSSTFCDICDTAGVCTTCQTFYGKKDSSTATCDPCPSNCAVCNTDGTCTECMDTYGLDDSGGCVGCPSGCSTCTISDGTCQTCLVDNKLDTTDSSCQPCPNGCTDSACEYDSTVGFVVCTACDEDPDTPQAVDDLGECLTCPSNCDSCQYNSTTFELECLDCAEFYGLDQNLNCEACSSGSYDCIYNASLGHMQTVCIDRPVVGSLFLPTTLAGGLAGLGECTSGSTTVYACQQDSYYYDSSTLRCEACTISNCDVCDTANFCGVCKSGYGGPQSDAVTCLACSATSNCAECDLNSGDESQIDCTACVTNYGLTSTLQCTRCSDSNCDICEFSNSGTETCDTCASRYVQNNNDRKACEACPTNCHTCRFSSGSAQCERTGCDEGYEYHDGTCVSCSNNCLECSSASGGVTCDLCEANYGLVTGDDNLDICQACSTRCLECSSSSSGTSCDLCEAGYALVTGSDNLDVCQACPTNCAECTFQSSSGLVECDTCLTGYTENREDCGACPSNCLRCEGSSTMAGSMACLECDSGYYVSSEQCVACGDSCLTCGTLGCAECRSGYIMQSEQCTACATATGDVGCSVCSGSDSSVVCTTCGAGYVLAETGDSCLAVPVGVCAAYEDRTWQCSNCTGTKVPLENGHCGYECYICPDGTTGNTPESCNLTTTNYAVEMCETGVCWAIAELDRGSETTTYRRGCDLTTTACDDTAQATGGYKSVVGNKKTGLSKREQCCSSTRCNGFTLSGAPSECSSLLYFVVLFAAVVAGLFSRLTILDSLV